MLRWFPLLLPSALAGCLFDEDPEVLRLSGETMGTTYNITVVGTDLDGDAMALAVTDSLASINAKMSNWDPSSEVSKFSASGDTQPVTISTEFAKVIAAANDVHAQSDGRFDVTLGPLIELWGFGPRKPEDPVPDDAAIAAALAYVGQDRLLMLDAEAGTLAKSDAAVGINLSAIAKGYGVDAVAATIEGFGVENYMVEIGGDLVTRGENDKGETWRIGIERPDASVQTVKLIVPVSDHGLATSGDYRNFFEQDGVRYSHIIDPTTGHPITHRTTSVTVVADDAMMADAWATALLVLGAEEGLKLAEEKELAAFFISRAAQDGVEPYIVQQSSDFAAILASQ
ncbi:FAD:protein FMN transferase [Ruegeria hyattellae]|uniref:FAD:protein FMN transferase n=1 Tax=Ruegeria hyattellae TaxID=3233337 RepID=UPI00355B99A7